MESVKYGRLVRVIEGRRGGGGKGLYDQVGVVGVVEGFRWKKSSSVVG